MAKLFDGKKWLGNKKGKKVTPGRMVMDVLIKKNALDEKHAIKVSAFKDVPLSSETIAYTIANLYDGGIIKITPKEEYYFDETAYKKFEKKTLIQFYGIFLFPLILFIIFYMIAGGGFKAFFR